MGEVPQPILKLWSRDQKATSVRLLWEIIMRLVVGQLSLLEEAIQHIRIPGDTNLHCRCLDPIAWFDRPDKNWNTAGSRGEPKALYTSSCPTRNRTIRPLSQGDHWLWDDDWHVFKIFLRPETAPPSPATFAGTLRMEVAGFWGVFQSNFLLYLIRIVFLQEENKVPLSRVPD